MSLLPASRRFVARNAHDHAVTVHAGADVFRSDEDICLPGLVRVQKRESRLVDRQCARNEIGFGGEDVAVLANARDLAGMLEFAQCVSEHDALAARQRELARNLDLIERPIIACREQPENLFSNFTSIFCHMSETIVLDVIVDLTKSN